jgi:hypothetical protein
VKPRQEAYAVICMWLKRLVTLHLAALADAVLAFI